MARPNTMRFRHHRANPPQVLSARRPRTRIDQPGQQSDGTKHGPGEQEPRGEVGPHHLHRSCTNIGKRKRADQTGSGGMCRGLSGRVI